PAHHRDAGRGTRLRGRLVLRLEGRLAPVGDVPHSRSRALRRRPLPHAAPSAPRGGGPVDGWLRGDELRGPASRPLPGRRELLGRGRHPVCRPVSGIGFNIFHDMFGTPDDRVWGNQVTDEATWR